MKVGIIGIGSTTLDFGARAAQAGYEVLINNPRGNDHCKEIINNLGKNAKISCIEKTAEAEIIILFLPWENLQITLEALPDMTEKIILHTNNYLFTSETTLTSPIKKTATQTIASLLPTAHIVKIFSADNSTRINSDRTRILYAAENKEAKKSVKMFLESLHFLSTELNEFNGFSEFDSVKN